MMGWIRMQFVLFGCVVFLFFVYFAFWRGGVVESQGFVCSKHFQESYKRTVGDEIFMLFVLCFFILKYFGFIWLRVVQDFNETKMEDSGVNDGDVEMKSDHSFRTWLVSHLWSVGEDGFFSGQTMSSGWKLTGFRLERNGVCNEKTHKISPIRWVLLGWKISGIWDFGEIWSHWPWRWPRLAVDSKWDFAGWIHIKKRLPVWNCNFWGASSPFVLKHWQKPQMKLSFWPRKWPKNPDYPNAPPLQCGF